MSDDNFGQDRWTKVGVEGPLDNYRSWTGEGQTVGVTEFQGSDQNESLVQQRKSFLVTF